MRSIWSLVRRCLQRQVMTKNYSASIWKRATENNLSSFQLSNWKQELFRFRPFRDRQERKGWHEGRKQYSIRLHEDADGCVSSTHNHMGYAAFPYPPLLLPPSVPAFPVVSAPEKCPSISQTIQYVTGTRKPQVTEAPLPSNWKAIEEMNIRARLFLDQPHDHNKITWGKLKISLFCLFNNHWFKSLVCMGSGIGWYVISWSWAWEGLEFHSIVTGSPQKSRGKWISFISCNISWLILHISNVDITYQQPY